MAAGWHKYQVIAYDAAGNARPSALFWALVPAVPPPPVDPIDPVDRDEADTTGPVLRIHSPGSGDRLRASKATISASATDDRQMLRMQIRIDGKRVAEEEGDRIRRVWSLRRVERGRHAITIRALDGSGNATTRTVRVRVSRARG